MVDAAVRPDAPLPGVLLVGHFHDRRATASLCAGDVTRCDSFVVDAVLEVQARPQEIPFGAAFRPDRDPAPAWGAAEVDARVASVAPHLRILARRVVSGDDLQWLEPGLGTGAHGLIDERLLWHVTALDATDPSHARTETFILVDGAGTTFRATDWDTSRTGFVELGPIAAATPGPTPALTDSPLPSQAVGFPGEVLGLPVVTVAHALEYRDAEERAIDEIRNIALAVRGWYWAPEALSCPPFEFDEPFAPIELRCGDQLRWLMDRPERPWEEVNGVREPRRPEGPALNPILRPDVSFPAPVDRLAEGPVPVVVIGHFFDPRARLLAESEYFVVDALVWLDGSPVASAPVTLSGTPTEDTGAVEARVARHGGPAKASWLTLISGSELMQLDGLGTVAGLADAETVWRLRRLVDDEGRPVVRTAYTVDGDDRVFLQDRYDNLTLQPSFTVALGDDVAVEIVDGLGRINGAAAATGIPPSDARHVERSEAHPEVWLSAVAGDRNALRVDWLGGLCDTTWTLSVWDAGPSINLVHPPIGACRLAGIVRGVIVRFDHPVDPDSVEVVHVTSGG